MTRGGTAAVAVAGLTLCGLVTTGSWQAYAQLGTITGSAARDAAPQSNQPVFYLADQASYDKGASLVTLSGHVEIWQGDRVMRADRVTYDRGSGVAAASGHVVLLEPDGQVLFSDYAELSGGMKDGVLKGMSARLAENGTLAANGARRTNGTVNELTRAIYTTCNLCRTDPTTPPLWDIRARVALQDITNKKIEYQDAVVDVYGVPVAYFPYLTHADPSVKRSSGFLIPQLGNSTHLGPFVALPYYLVLDGASDLTVTPLVAGKTGPEVNLGYRRRFNAGEVVLTGSIAGDKGQLQGSVFTHGQFALNDEWRAGFDINRASSATYLRDFKLTQAADLLTSQVYLEGFGQGSYSKLDARVYQGVSSSIIAARLPYVIPRYEYDFEGQPDALGGRTSIEATAFNVIRDQGTNTRRAGLRANWERPAIGAFGDVWKATFHLDTTAYNASQLNQQPTYGSAEAADTAQAMPTATVMARWPLQREAGAWGTQVVEPIVQLVAAPNASSYGGGRVATRASFVNTLVPNEDSLGFEFTDATLFSVNRFPGIDRLEGGARANVALHAAWITPSGGQIDTQVGQSYRAHRDPAFPIGSGLDGTVSDIVGHVSVSPSPYLDLTSQYRLAHRNLDVRFADALASFGPSWLRVSGGYLFSNVSPYTYYDLPPTGAFATTPRNEASFGVAATFGHYRVTGDARQDLQTGKLVTTGFSGVYENECVILSGAYSRRYTSLANDHGESVVLFQVTLKTVGTFGFHPF